MKAAPLKRLQRLEEVRATEHRPLELQFGYLNKLPPDYTGERHVVTLGRLPDWKYQWEERPGPAPANEDEDYSKTGKSSRTAGQIAPNRLTYGG